MKKLLLVVGGQSTEHTISRMSGTSVYRELDVQKYVITVAGIDQKGDWYLLSDQVSDFTSEDWLAEATPVHDVYALLKRQDVIFPVLHGLYGEDGTIQGLFELSQVPYVGCRVLGSSLAMDKIFTKKIFEQAGIPQVPSLYVKKRIDGRLVVVDDMMNEHTHYADYIVEKLGLPVFVKPSNSGSSVGVYQATSKEDLVEKLKAASRYDHKIVVEKSIDCIELETAVLGNDDPQVSAVGQIMPHGEFYTFESKYEDEESKTCIPALVDQAIQEKIRQYALRAFQAIDGHGLSRVDFFLDKQTGAIYLNEINTMPGFTNISMYPQLWIHAGMTYSELLDRLIELALEIH